MFQEKCGYFDLAIDTSEVNLAVRYTVTASNASTSNIADIRIVGYSFPGQQNYITYLTNNQTSVQSSIAAGVSSATVRIYVEWDEDPSTQTLNDVQDTQIALNGGKAKVDVNVLFEQLVN